MKPIYHIFRSIYLAIGLMSLLMANGQHKISDFDPAAALERHISYQGLEKSYVHTDKDFYATGETIWFKAYLVDGTTHRKSDRSRVVYVDLLNEGDSLVARKKLYVENLGANGEIAVDKKFEQGTYTLRAYTRYMLNEKRPRFFEKKYLSGNWSRCRILLRTVFRPKFGRISTLSKTPVRTLPFFPKAAI